jgi:DNA-binding transcriptional ArsR family regulator
VGRSVSSRSSSVAKATLGDSKGRQSALASRPSSVVRATPSESKGRQSPLELDRLIHERLRLGIVSALAVNDRLTFNDLKRLLKTTDGNLSVHARKLEDAEYITCAKSFDGRMPRTEFRVAPAGRRALEKYLGHMEAIIKAVRD